AVHEDIELDLLLPPDPLLGGPPLQGRQLIGADLFAGLLPPAFQEIRGVAETPHGRRGQAPLRHAAPSRNRWAPAANTSSFRWATLRGRNSSPALGPTCRRSAGTNSAPRRQAEATRP